jgi:hypothetical protein
MVGDVTYSRERVGALATLAAIWIARVVAGAVATVLVVNPLFTSSVAALTAARVAAYAFVGGAVLRSVLPRLATLEISYGAAALALGLGSASGVLVTVLLWRFAMAAHGAPAASTIPLAGLGSMSGGLSWVAALAVSYAAVTALACEHADGLVAIRDALARLRELGVLRGG